MNLSIPIKLKTIITDIKNNGGESFLVGGAVIDIIQKRELKDWDIEVYKLSLKQLEDILSKHGKPNLVGKSFGVIKIHIDKVEYDFSIPRKENRIGVGHKDFNIELVPFIAPKEAAERRDLTINSMFFDLSNNELIDPHNGMSDLKKGILRHTSDKFTEDPLRVLRIMQLLPRKGKTVATETIELCKSLSGEFTTLVKERVFEEFNKLLMKSEKPSIGLQFLIDCDWIKHFLEIDILRNTSQNEDWHPEGNVWNHTMLVLDNAAELRSELPEEWQLAFMYGALLHDVGKPKTTTEELTSHGHNTVGKPIAKKFMKRLTNDRDLIEKTINIVRYHMRPGALTGSGAKLSAWKRLHNAIPLNVIGMMSKADSTGRKGRDLKEKHATSEKCFELFEQFGIKRIEPVLKGRDLIDAGYEPSPLFGKMLKNAYEIQIEEDINDKSILLERVK